jgi:uncharacterized membrane protein
VKPSRFLAALLLLGYLLLPGSIVQAQAEPAVVRAVLFYSPTCGHCEYVINNVLRPMIEQYGDQLLIAGIDVTQQQGQTLFLAAMQKFGFESVGVPFLVIDDKVLIGSTDIPEKFPDLVKSYLAQGGVDWPEIPGLAEILIPPSETSESPTTEPTITASSTKASSVNASPQTETVLTTTAVATISPVSPSPTVTAGYLGLDNEGANWYATFALDLAGNTLAVIVLLGMLGAIVWAILIFKIANGISMKERWVWIIPLLCLIGMVVAGYLAYVETMQVEAVCGPVGDCNTVQQSEYASLFGVLPIGVLGLIGYAAILLAWLIARFASDHLSDLAVLAIFIMTIFGTLFSIYLTFLEPFVIGASCAWCLTSAILMTLLMLLSVRPTKTAYARFSRNSSKPLS